MNVDVLLTPTKPFPNTLYFLPPSFLPFSRRLLLPEIAVRRWQQVCSGLPCTQELPLPWLLFAWWLPRWWSCRRVSPCKKHVARVLPMSQRRWRFCSSKKLWSWKKWQLLVFFRLTWLACPRSSPSWCVFGTGLGAWRVTHLPYVGQLASLWCGHRLYDLFYQYLKFISTK